ncbi:MAG: CAP domain-containing protein [Actinobacteria bacterium]|nr:CAP domain-containing protein [Actinomycetota bacterium]
MPTGHSLHRSPKPRDNSRGLLARSRYWWALAAVPVVAGAGLYVAVAPSGGGAATQAQERVTTVHPSHSATAAPNSATDVQVSSRCSVEGAASTGSGTSAACSVGAAGIAHLPGGGSGRPHPKASASSASASASASAPGSMPSASASASGSAGAPSGGSGAGGGAQQGEPADEVLALINQARSQNGLPALTFSAGLDQSASQHNSTMAAGCGLSHQCPGEPAIGDRETAAGVHWTAAGENIGEEGPVSDTTAAIAQAGVALTQDMLNEQPPNDGHRLNILSTSYTHIGIAVYRDSKGTVWLTQDFSN